MGVVDNTEGKCDLVFFLNGRKIVEANPDPGVTLLHYLRQKLYLTGTKEGCGQGGCGACTVMLSYWNQKGAVVRNVSANACLVNLCSLHGIAVTTVEGVGSVQSGLHPIQKSLVNSGGMQCGFCTPGMVMSMYALLRNKPNPTTADIQQAIEGNLCRCTGYRPIFDAFKSFTTACPLGENCCQNSCGDTEVNPETCKTLGNKCVDSSKISKCSSISQTQDPIFPPALQLSDEYTAITVVFRGPSTTWIRPVTLTELLTLKAEHPEAPVVMGNTVAGYQMKIGQIKSSVIIQGTHVPELKMTSVCAEGLTLGAGVTLTEVSEELTKIISKTAESQTRHFCALRKMINQLGSVQIRNVATFGGNIMGAAANGDLNPILLAAGVMLQTESRNQGNRSLKMTADFFCGLRKTSLHADEVLVSVTIPYSKQNEYIFGFKQCQRIGFDMAVVNAGMLVCFHDNKQTVDKMRLCYGGMAANIVMAKKTSEKCLGMLWSEELLENVCDGLMRELALPCDAPGGMVKYKMALLCSLFYKFYLEINAQLQLESVQDRSATNTLLDSPYESSQVYEAVDPSQKVDDPVGRPLPHLASQQLSSGQASYVDDWPKMENELFLALVMSKRAHARIISVDPSEALSLSGVVDYISHQDVPGSNLSGIVVETEEVFASVEVSCYGQVIGGVLAETRDIARKAVNKVKVEYKDLDPILTIQQAIDANSFYGDPLEIKSGDVDAGFLASDHVIEGELSIGGQEHFYMETQSVIVTPKNENDEFEILVSAQWLDQIQVEVSKILGVKQNRIVCKTKRSGGGFGGKETSPMLVCGPAAVAAKKTGRRVRCIFDRAEDVIATGKRHQMLARYKVGFLSTGKMKSLQLDLFANSGSRQETSRSIILIAMFHAGNCYNFPNVLLRGHACATNIPSRSAFRGFGVPQAIWVAENILTDVAKTIGKGQEQIREMNFLREGDVNHWNQKIEGCTLQKCWDTCLQQSQCEGRKQDVGVFNRENRWKKRGFAAIPVMFTIGMIPRPGTQAGALVSIYKDGSVLVAHGGVELGQGLHTKMTQVASRALSVPIENIFINETSTDTVPNATATAGSMSSDYNGMAIVNACKVLNDRLQPYKNADPGGSWENWVKSAYSDCISLSTTGFYKGRDENYNILTNKGRGMDYYTYGAICTEVEIDCLTGEHKVLQVDIVMDVGKSLNPNIDIGQIEGGFVQGYGLMTMEQLKMTPDGRPLNFGPSTYKIPTVTNIPQKFNVTLLKDCPNEKAVYSSKGIGEPPLLLAASVFLAIKSAIGAARHDEGLSDLFRLDCPATVERIRLACHDRFTKLQGDEDQSDPTFLEC